jgi:PleD family two-component response regulator
MIPILYPYLSRCNRGASARKIRRPRRLPRPVKEVYFLLAILGGEMENKESRTSPADHLVAIVDDDSGIQELLGFLLAKEGFRVESMMDGEEALRKIPELKPSLVILDIMLPLYDGFVVLKKLQTGETLSIPIIIITGRFSDRSTLDLMMLESNVKDFMQKPIDGAALTKRIHELLKTVPNKA